MKPKKNQQSTLTSRNRLVQKNIFPILIGSLLLSGILIYMQVSDTTSNDRVSNGLVVLYDFEEGSGTTVNDVSGNGPPLNLTISDSDDATWIDGGGISINASTIISSSSAASKINTAVQASSSITLEVWVKCANTTQDGPARILTFSKNTGKRNFTLGQEDDDYRVRLTTSSTNTNGLPEFASSNNTVNTSSIQHIVYTLDASGNEKFYINGALDETGTRSGHLHDWDGSWDLAIGNEMTNNRSWLGEIYLAAVYDRSLSATEVNQNYQHGLENIEEFAAVAPSLPGGTASGWSTDTESTSYEVELIGRGISEESEGGGEGAENGNTFSLTIPNPENVSHIMVETIVKGGTPDISYTTALGTVTAGYIGVPKAGSSSGNNFKVYRSILKGAPTVSSVTMETSQINKTYSMTATIFRTGTGITETSTGIYVQEYFIRNSATYQFTIPAAPQTGISPYTFRYRR